MRIKHFLGLGTGALLVWLIVDGASQPSPQELPGDFQEVALFRNENNTGPIVRLYVVTVGDTSGWQQMQQYGALMPYTKYGTTKVFFFAKNGPFPTRLQLAPPHFAATLNRYCLASYEKDLMSKVSFAKYPLK